MRCVIFIVVNSVYFSKSLRSRTRPICLSVTHISRTHTRIDSVKIQKYCHPCVRDCASMWGYFSFLSSFHFHLIRFSSVWLRWVEFSLFHCRCYYCYLPFSLNFNILLLFFSVHFHCHNSIIPFFFSSIYTMCKSNIHAQAHVCLFVWNMNSHFFRTILPIKGFSIRCVLHANMSVKTRDGLCKRR